MSIGDTSKSDEGGSWGLKNQLDFIVPFILRPMGQIPNTPSTH